MPSGSNVLLDIVAGYSPPSGDSITLNVGVGATEGVAVMPIALVEAETIYGDSLDVNVISTISDVNSDIITGFILDSALLQELPTAEASTICGEVANCVVDNIASEQTAEVLSGGIIDSELTIPSPMFSGSISEFGAIFASLEHPIALIDVNLITGEALTPILVQPSVSSESTIVTGEMLSASLTSPIQTAIADHEQENVITGTATNPIATVDSQFSALTFGDLSMPLATVSGVAGSTFGEATMPISTVAIDYSHGSLVTGEINAPLNTVNCAFQAVTEGFATPPSSSVSSSIATGYIVSAELSSAMNDVDAIIDSENGVTANIIQVIAETSGVIISNAFVNSSIVQPSAEMVGVIAGALNDVFTTYAMNIENSKVTQYTNFDSLAMAKIGGVYLSIAKDGIYLMDGDTDNGNVIDARVRFGMDDMGSEYQKRVQYAYVGSKGTVGLRMLTDSDNEADNHDATHQGNGIGTRRIKLGKGTKSRYWQPEITGNSFELDSVSLEAEVLSRKVA